ncbi:MAG TPA: hypothetical protein VKJ77_15345, partial [Caballeronia sp.]|nr:hypothetical protein [Caballeronia sp.]
HVLTYAHHGTLKSATFPIFHGSTLVAPTGSVHFPIPFIALIPLDSAHDNRRFIARAANPA